MSKPYPLSKMQSALGRARQFLTPTTSSATIPQKSKSSDFIKVPFGTALFQKVSKAEDGEDCDHDCESCEVEYPKKWSIDEDDKLYGQVKGFSTHMLVATGKTDWVRDVADEKGSVMEAVGKHGNELKNGKLMLSASNMPIWDGDIGILNPAVGTATDVLILPAWKMVKGIRPRDVPELLDNYVQTQVTNTTPIGRPPQSQSPNGTANGAISEAPPEPRETQAAADPPTPPAPTSTTSAEELATLSKTLSFTHAFHSTPCPHSALILLCSQKTRDARCGQSAPLLRREFERHLRPLGLYRDLQDTRPGGVGIYFISHVGGHKYAANVMVYRHGSMGRKWKSLSAGFLGSVAVPASNGGRSGSALDSAAGSGAVTPAVLDGERCAEEDGGEGAVQGIWLARVRPEDCEGIVRYTVLQGKVVKPERQLRGGFDRERGLVSW